MRMDGETERSESSHPAFILFDNTLQLCCLHGSLGRIVSAQDRVEAFMRDFSGHKAWKTPLR